MILQVVHFLLVSSAICIVVVHAVRHFHVDELLALLFLFLFLFLVDPIIYSSALLCKSVFAVFEFAD